MTFEGETHISRLQQQTQAAGKALWRANPPLTATGLVMLLALAVSLAGLWTDPRTITGAPAWLKPTKFAVSIAIYTFTLAWIFTFLPAWPRTRRFVGWTSAAVFILEIALIDLQAWRGTTSHFNVGAPLDAVIFSVMGLAIIVQTLASVAVAVALSRQPFVDRALGWALRLGLSVTIVGALSGGLMTRPTSPQLSEARSTGRMAVAGAHTVGAPDGGPGLPGTNWSREHGDLRIPHFLGLHAMQVIPLIAVWSRRRLTEAARVRLAVTTAASYLSLFAILMWQAFRGQAVVRPDASTIMALGVWFLITIVATWIAVSSGRPFAARAAAR